MLNILAGLLILVVGILVNCGVSYLVIRQAVLSALREHDKSPTGAPQYVTSGTQRRPASEDPYNWG
jgi:hypothetical protein